MDDKKVFVVCSRVSECPKSEIDGSEKDICFKCRHEVWISPGTKKTKIDHQGETVCFTCALADGAKEFKIESHQVEEAFDQIRRNAQNN